MKNQSLFILGLCAMMLSVQSARAFLGLAVRVGVFYTAYKFIDGIADSGMSHFVDKYSDGPIDAICSFGSGVKRFGLGVRNAVGTFSSEKSDSALSKSWNVLKQDWDASIETTKKEWKDRRAVALSKKEKEKRQRNKSRGLLAQAAPRFEVMPELLNNNVIAVQNKEIKESDYAIG